MSDYPGLVALAVDVVTLTVRDDKLHILLVQRSIDPFVGQWTLPGVFLAKKWMGKEWEELTDAAERALESKAGLVAHVEQLGTYGSRGRDPRNHVVSVAYIAFAPDLGDPTPGPHVSDAKWEPVAALEGGWGLEGLAFDHNAIALDGVIRAQNKLEYTTLATRFLPEEFTIGDLQKVYEAVWMREIDSGNFYRKVKQTKGFIVPINERRGRAQLYVAGEATMLYPPIRKGD